MSREDFESAVRDGLDAIPDEFAKQLVNIAVLVEDDPPPGHPYLLGLYQGIPLTARNDSWAAGSMPDRITIFRNPILTYCHTEAEVRRQVRVTVIHEVGHYFGLDDARLHELGWA